MKAAVCTLFEGDFHFGVGALVNSLYTAGFRGNVWVGFRGALPPWAHPARVEEGVSIFAVAAGCDIRFVPVETPRHLTNFKAVFMRRVFEQLAADCQQLYYFDPDIIVRTPWLYFADWASEAVALSEDVNSPIPDSHPKRNRWRRLFGDISFRTPLDVYVNGGFVGISRRHAEFLIEWECVIGRMQAAGIEVGNSHFQDGYTTWIVDQDALNITAMSTGCPLSLAGKEGMGFFPGSSPMLHQIGRKKPWHRRFLQDLLAGSRPSQAQRLYWEHARSPIRLYSDSQIHRGQIENLVAALVSRFYSR